MEVLWMESSRAVLLVSILSKLFTLNSIARELNLRNKFYWNWSKRMWPKNTIMDTYGIHMTVLRSFGCVGYAHPKPYNGTRYTEPNFEPKFGAFFWSYFRTKKCSKKWIVFWTLFWTKKWSIFWAKFWYIFWIKNWPDIRCGMSPILYKA